MPTAINNTDFPGGQASSGPKLYLVLAALNVTVWLIQILRGVPWLDVPPATLLAWGANAAPLTLTGEWWRLATSMFLHGGLLHLAMNIYMLMLCGAVTERQLGVLGFGTVYLVAGLGGSLTSAWWAATHKVLSSVFAEGSTGSDGGQLQLVVSVGASGALMGMVGALLAYRWVGAGAQGGDEASGARFNTALLQIVGINIALGWLVPGIDQAAHIGGLLTGAVTGALLALSTGAAEPRSRLPRQCGVLAVMLLGLWAAAAAFTPSAELLALRQALRAELVPPPGQP